MKTIKLSVISIVVILLAALYSCEKENNNLTNKPANKDDPFAIDALIKEATTSPYVIVDDPVLQDHARISQSREDYIKYEYDREGKISAINYYRSDYAALSSTDDDQNLFMADKFVYNNSNQLQEILRYEYGVVILQAIPSVKKAFTYDKSGKLVQIVTGWLNSPMQKVRYELISYNNIGNMIGKTVRGPGEYYYSYEFSYDKQNRLARITAFTIDGVIDFYCLLTYDKRDNIQVQEFYFPEITGSSADIAPRWIVKYDYDINANPFKNMRLPYMSLFEWMDLVSFNNYTMIAYSEASVHKVVYYKYRYNDLRLPILRVRVENID